MLTYAKFEGKNTAAAARAADARRALMLARTTGASYPRLIVIQLQVVVSQFIA
jgi:hypothetical protein